MGAMRPSRPQEAPEPNHFAGDPSEQIILLEIRVRKAIGKIRNKLCRKHFAFYQSASVIGV